ncbi:hypothetical protein [Fictibacillus sp. 18YEL24]|uniref:hypothetical protein n=1 Tax=Fictibacillus sp. 18YEL24 TaxID=2745875 RepID=UPI0018CFB8EE|nr:hypothetical protein [Fictibacillus sp. 18YEL24]MBH0171010.1 hypothetical protein [Fictibacillus sp. 18YEL24]
MIDIREHGGNFGGGKYRKGTVLGGFTQAIIESGTILAKTIDAGVYGAYNPSINLQKNFIFFVGGNAQNIQLTRFDLTTGGQAWGPTMNGVEGSIVDANGNSYVLGQDTINKMNDYITAVTWSKTAAKVGYNASRSRGGSMKKDVKNSTSTHLYFCIHWSPYNVFKIAISDGTVTSITPVGSASRVSAFEVHEDLNAIFAINGSKVMRLDLNWNIIWEKDTPVSGISPDDVYSNIIVDKKRNCILALWGSTSGTIKKHLVKLDYNGNIIQGPVDILAAPYSLQGAVNTVQLFEVIEDYIFFGYANQLYTLNAATLERTAFQYNFTESTYQAFKMVGNDTIHIGSTSNYRKYQHKITLA